MKLVRRLHVGEGHHQGLDAQMEDDVLASDTSPLRVTLNQELLQILGFIAEAKSETLKQSKITLFYLKYYY